MDAHKQPRERIFSILNDNACPSFTIKRIEPLPASPKVRPSISPIQERPHLLHFSQLSKRNSSVSSSRSPPLLRFDSTSSKSSSSSMDSTPSPLTPAYNDGALSYDNLVRQDMGYLPSPTNITPYMEQQMMLNPIALADPFQQQYLSKPMPTLAPAQYPIAPLQSIEPQNIPPPSLTSDTSASTSLSSSTAPVQSSPVSATATTNPPKKNKYPCPYAASHNCVATFTTSGHAARHGKKHTGEKGVHCPVCKKAFTRKDNMKQHERTHKGSLSGSSAHSDTSESAARRSKAAITKEAHNQKIRAKKSDADPHARRSSIIHSPLSEVTSLAPAVIATPLILDSESMLYPTSDSVVPQQVLLPTEPLASVGSLYPPLGEENMLNGHALTAAASMVPLPALEKQVVMGGITVPALPPLVRGFSDLETLAYAAESFNPYEGQM